MNKTIKMLTVLLAVQVILIAGIWLKDVSSTNAAPAAALLDVDFRQVDGIVLAGKDKTTVLTKNATDWKLPEHGDLLAQQDKVGDLLDSLKELKGGWPVATTDSAAERFEVADDNALRKITLKQGDKELGTLLAGTSPGFRKVHVRLPGESEVYAVEFALYEAPADSNDWIDKSLLKFNGDVKKVQVWGLEATREGSGDEKSWALSQLPEGHEVDGDAIDSWVGNFTSLNVSGLVDDETAKSIEAGEPALVAKLSDDEQSVEYRVFRKDDKSFVKSSASDHLFEMADYTAKTIIEAKEDGFSSEKESEDTEEKDLEETSTEE